MAFITFYNGRTLTPVQTFQNEIEDFSFTIGLNGSANGNVVVTESSSNRSFLNSLKENSHYVKFGKDYTYGGVVDTVQHDRDKWTINFIGVYEWFDKVDAVASHKANQASGVLHKEDQSWIKVFYGDSATSIFYETLINLKDSMSARGYDNSVIDISQYNDPTVFNVSGEWNRSYRLNSLETPTMKSVMDDVLTDEDMATLNIRVTSSRTEKFRFIFEIIQSSASKTVDEAGDIFDVSRDDGNVQRRSFSIAKGTDLKDNSVIERVDFDSNSVYSALITESQQERSNSVRKTAQSSITTASTNLGNLSFSSHLDNYEIHNYLTVGSAAMESISGVLVEKSIEGNIVNYKIQIGQPSKFNASLSKATNAGQRIIYKPIGKANQMAAKAVRSRNNSTGWRV